MLVRLKVNGEMVEISAPAHCTLLDWLREHLHLMGTRAACDLGDCGSCAVLIDGVATLSCVTLLVEARGRCVKTVEGLTWSGEAHPIQQAFHEMGASQCGFCTPGFVVSSTALIAENDHPSDEEIKDALSGNLCRCTGYSRIVEAVKRAAEIVRTEKACTPATSPEDGVSR